MTERELREIKRRFRPEKSNIPRIVGCLVNGNKQIVSKINQSIGVSESDASEGLLNVMKKTLSGSLGTNLHDVKFSTKQVSESEEHKLLMDLRASSLKDSEVLDKFYSKVIESVSFEGNYVILLANDIYDVFTKSSDELGEDSSEVFNYIICAVCPVKDTPEAISFKESDSLFHTASISSVLSSPVLGFMFPSFDDRKTNIYDALYYTKSVADEYPDFCKNVFAAESPMAPKMQKETFNVCLSEVLSEDCTLDVVRSVQSQLAEIVEAHKESKDPEPLTITKATVKTVLENCGVAEEKIEKLGEALDESFGTNAALTPKNVVTFNKFELSTPDVTVKVDPEHRDLVTTQVINGTKYVMIRVEGPVEVNGINVKIED